MQTGGKPLGVIFLELPDEVQTLILLTARQQDLLQLRLASKAFKDIASKHILAVYSKGALVLDVRRAFPNASIFIVNSASSKQLLEICSALWAQFTRLEVLDSHEAANSFADNDEAVTVLLSRAWAIPKLRCTAWRAPISPTAAGRLLRVHPQPYLHITRAAGQAALPSDLQSLEELVVSCNSASSSANSQGWDLSSLATARKLRSLTLNKVLLTAAVGACKALQSLTVIHQQATAQQFPLQPLADLTQLTSLVLRGVNCPGGSWEVLAGLPLLHTLNVNYLQLPAADEEAQPLASLKSFTTGHWLHQALQRGALAAILPALEALTVIKAHDSVNSLVLACAGHSQLKQLLVQGATPLAASGIWQPAAQLIPSLLALQLPPVTDTAALLSDLASTRVSKLILGQPGESAVQHTAYDMDTAARLLGAVTSGSIRASLRELQVQHFCKLRMEEAVLLAAQLPGSKLQAAVVLPRKEDEQQVQLLMAMLRHQLLHRGWFLPGVATPAVLRKPKKCAPDAQAAQQQVQATQAIGHQQQDTQQQQTQQTQQVAAVSEEPVKPGISATITYYKGAAAVPRITAQVHGWQGMAAGVTRQQLELDVYVEPVGLDTARSTLDVYAAQVYGQVRVVSRSRRAMDAMLGGVAGVAVVGTLFAVGSGVLRALGSAGGRR